MWNNYNPPLLTFGPFVFEFLLVSCHCHSALSSWCRRERLCLYYQMVQEKIKLPTNDTRYQVNLLLELMQVI